MKTQEKEGRLCSIVGMVGGDGLRAQRGCWGAGEPRWERPFCLWLPMPVSTGAFRGLGVASL